MNNKGVIIAFLNGREAHTPKREINSIISYKGCTLKSRIKNGVIELINYSTVIAYYTLNTNTINVNTRKYSSTTSKIQNILKYEINSEYWQVVEYEG